MIATLVDNTTEIYDRSFLELNIDEDNLESLKNDAFRNALFYESLKREDIDNSCYLYLLISENFYSKYSFLNYVDISSTEAILIEYFKFTFQNNSKSQTTISSLDKLLLQIASPIFEPSMEIDHIYPKKGKTGSNSQYNLLNLNHIGNLCYLSKLNNQIKSNKLPSIHITSLRKQQKWKLLEEFKSQIFWNKLNSKLLFGEINSTGEYEYFIKKRVEILVKRILEKL